MHTNIETLRTIGANAQANRPLDMDQLAWLGDCVARFLGRQANSLDEAFGLCLGRGGMPWWIEEANRTRDEALRRLADMVCAGDSPTARARKVGQLAIRYAGSTWRHDAEHDDMPAHYRDTVKDCLWIAFKSGARMPLCERQLRNILA